ncbi:MAG: tellurite resistance/C4-dicarboxylate transporter family protein [Myxococcales bacterium]
MIARLHPATFALVMATGIVSIACELNGLRPIAIALLVLNCVFYVAVWVLTVLRAVLHRDRLIADFLDHGRSVGFFTTVAATCVLGSQLLIVGGFVRAAIVLWCVGVVLAFVLTYTIFGILTVKEQKPTLAEGINGGWLVGVVAAQSVAVLGAQLAREFTGHEEKVAFFCLFIWLGGCMLYLWIISLIFYRYTFFVMSPSDLAPPYWINMGAAAISTLAGAMLILAAPISPVLQQILPFVRGFTLFWWSIATWWIPMLVILGIWRHLYRKFPLRYDTLYWGAVFPLGMYTVCTVRLSRAVDAAFLLAIPRVFVYVALCAWALAFFGLLLELRPERGVPTPSGRF